MSKFRGITSETTEHDVLAWADDIFVRLELMGAFDVVRKKEQLKADHNGVIHVQPMETR